MVPHSLNRTAPPTTSPKRHCRRHAQIVFDGGAYWIEDLKSTNGTYVNGVPVPIDGKERLRHLDIIGLGKEAELLFLVREKQKPSEVKQQAIVREVLGEGEYELKSLEAHGGTRSPIGTPLWDAVAAWVEHVEPEARPAPICVAGFTDSHWFRQAFGTIAYGFFPSRVMSPELAARLIHSADERIPVDDLELGVDFLRHAAQSLGTQGLRNSTLSR